MTAQVQEKLNSGIRTSLSASDVVDRIVKVGAVPEPSTSEALRKLINSESAKWIKVLKEAREYWIENSREISSDPPIVGARYLYDGVFQSRVNPTFNENSRVPLIRHF